MPEEDKVEVEATEKEMSDYLKFKSKHKWPSFHIDRQTGLRLFREKYGVEHGSTYHCPWCYEGKLFHNPEEDFYVCRKCELRFEITCLDMATLGQFEETKKQEREAKREEKREQRQRDGGAKASDTLSQGAIDELERT